MAAFPLVLTPTTATLQTIPCAAGGACLPGGTCYEATGTMTDADFWGVEGVGEELVYDLEAGALSGLHALTFDLLVDGEEGACFGLFVEAGEKTFRCSFSALPQAQARFVLPAEALRLNAWLLGRRGALLKPLAGGDPVRPEAATRIRFLIQRKTENPLRFCMTPLTAVATEPEALTAPLLPKGPLLDEMGQSTIRDWSTKTKTVGEMGRRLGEQVDAAGRARWPEGFSRWGGYQRKWLGEGTDFFRRLHDGKRWWLVDPEGYAFWSTGLDCVAASMGARYDGLEDALAWTPATQAFETILAEAPGNREGRYVDYLKANWIRKFGPDGWPKAWAAATTAHLRRWGFNTIGNWSDIAYARRTQFPYVRPLALPNWETPMLFRDLPDVFAPSFAREAAAYATQLESTREDTALVGYFLMNEPKWGFAAQTPAEGMLLNTETAASRAEFAKTLKAKYGSDEKLATAWGMEVDLERIERGRWDVAPPAAAREDLEAFSTVLIQRLFDTLLAACRAVDPNHLCLGARYYTVPPAWATAGMQGFDVFAVNCYKDRPLPEFGGLSETVEAPVMIGEFHFGALDAGLPGAGIGRVDRQEDRAKAYRVYVEDAAAQPWCVGAHYFTLYDESALGRFDGENWNIGFLDVCNRPYLALGEAARASHERLYDVALGKVDPYTEAPIYRPPVFC